MSGKAIPNRVLVTGGGRGIGAAIVRTLAAGGHDVLFTYRTDQAGAQALAAKVAEESGRAIDVARLDLVDKAAVDAFAEGLATGEPYYGFVHNAGQSYDTLLALLDQTKAEATMQVNFFAFTRLAAALVRPMTSRRAGRIVAIASIAALRAGTGNGAYAATKAAMIGYARTLAIETARRGVTVNCVAPGFVDTEMLGSYAAQREKTEGQIPAGRYARPEDVAGVVGFLMSPAAARPRAGGDRDQGGRAQSPRSVGLSRHGLREAQVAADRGRRGRRRDPARGVGGQPVPARRPGRDVWRADLQRLPGLSGGARQSLREPGGRDGLPYRRIRLRAGGDR